MKNQNNAITKLTGGRKEERERKPFCEKQWMTH